METDWISIKDGVLKLVTDHRVAQWREPEELFNLLRDERGLIWLDSGMDHGRMGAWSYMMYNPFRALLGQENDYTIWERGEITAVYLDPFELLKVWMAEFEAQDRPDLPPFTGGACGFFGYELLTHCEPSTKLLRDDRADEGDLWIGFYDSVYAFNHQTREVYLITNGHDGSDTGPMLDSMEQILASGIPSVETKLPILTPKSNFTREEYINAVERIRQYIAEGDCYQVNLSQRFELDCDFDPADMYLRLRSISPAPFGAYMNLGRHQILSTSPERFINLRNGHAQTCPIKGTRPRGEDKQTDAKLRVELQHSGKDKAENVMIVDLLRNDLSKVCLPSSVVVTGLCEVESFPTVHHLVSTIEGDLSAEHTALDLLKNAFPGGSITGAPKIRSMDIINELEPHPRGVYCGAMGYIGFNGAMDTNIVIRTMVRTEKIAKFNVGGGVTYLSDPKDEYEETLDKAKALMQAVTGWMKP